MPDPTPTEPSSSRPEYCPECAEDTPSRTVVVEECTGCGAPRSRRPASPEHLDALPRLVIVMDPQRCGGKPTVQGTRLAVDTMLETIRAELRSAAQLGRSEDTVHQGLAADYPGVPSESWPVLLRMARTGPDEHPRA